MRKIKRLWAPMLLGVFLTIMLAGVAGARPNARPLEQAWRVLAVPPQACTAIDPTIDYAYHSNLVACNSGACELMCPVYFPAAGEQAVGAVNVKRVTMYAYDNYPLQDTNFLFAKIHPQSGLIAWMASAVADNVATNPQAVVDYTIVGNPVYRVQAPFLWVDIAGSDPVVYGFYIHYTWM